MSYRFQISIILVTLVIIITGCGDKIEPGTAANPPLKSIKAAIDTARVSQQPFIYEAVGTVVPRTASTLSSKLMGTVHAVNVHEGDQVKEGDLLVVLDQRQVSAGFERARAALNEALKAEASAESARKAAKAAAELAHSTYVRYQKLIKENSASQQEFEEVESRHRQAQASLAQTESMLAAASSRVEQARAAVDSASVSKKDAKVYSPYNGTITAKMISVGDLASPGTPFLTIEKEDAFCADLVLPERHIQAVKLDDEVKVSIPALLGTVDLTGIIGRIVPTADIKSRSFLVKVALSDNDNLRSGMFARVAIPVGEAGMLMLPNSAIVNQGQLTGVYVVDDDQIAHFRLIRTGKHYGDAVEILSGIFEKDRYIIAPPSNLNDGDKIEVTK
jgi:multidrug efflux pump subunit AcrA (membrane-fusion protein)